MIPEVQAYLDAEATYEAARKVVTTLAAHHIDAHPELDTTGEWARIREAFPNDYAVHWHASDDYEGQIRFHKTTQRGLYDHEITVRLEDLTPARTTEEIKIGYRLKDSTHTSTAYVTKTSDTEAVGTNKHTDEPITVRWTGTEWVQV